MTEVLFYHLERRPLEQVLPLLVEKTLERGWRAVIQAGSDERCEALSTALWTWREESFLPHGTAGDGNSDLQPVWLTSTTDNPNRSNVRFYVDGTSPGEIDELDRAIYMFDGRDDDAVTAARDEWKRMSAAGHDVTYWQQDENGRWQKKA